MSGIRVDMNIALTPEQVAAAFWNLGSDGQAQFFASLDRQAGIMLCFQMAGVVREIAKLETDDHSHALNGFRTMFAHAIAYFDDAIDIRAQDAYGEIAGMVRDAKRLRFRA